jgi:hypothetical protein
MSDMNWSLAAIATLAGLTSFVAISIEIINVYQRGLESAAAGDVAASGDAVVGMVVLLTIFVMGFVVYLIE